MTRSGNKSVRNKSVKQSKRSARSRTGEKGQDRKAPAGRGRLGGGGPSSHPPNKPTPTASPEPEPAPGSREDANMREIDSRFRPEEMGL